MLAWFSNWQFAPYKHVFQPYGEAGTLDKTELRYAWLRQLLKQYDELYCHLFPSSWQVALEVTRQFCSITHKHLEEILDQSRGALDVAVLTHALQKTVEFEKEMHARFSDAATDRRIVDHQVDADGADSPEPAEGARVGLLGSVSGCFDSYMSIYVSLEDKSIEEALAKLLAEEAWSASIDRSGGQHERVFTSSKGLVLALKKSFKRGTALHMNAVVVQLAHVWSKQLRSYAKKIDAQLPTIGQPAEPSLPPTCNLDTTQQQMVCAVVNTCKYCSETTSQLEDSILKTLDEEHATKVDLSPAKEDFQGTVTAGMRVLVAALESRLAPALTAMSKVKWDTMDELREDTSPYMVEAVTKAREVMPLLGEALIPLYVRFFCDKFVEAFVPRFIGHILRLKSIGEVGAQQMQVDVGTLKATLLEMPTLGQASPTGYYTKLVANEIAKAEQVLKLVQTPEEHLESTLEEMRGSGISIDLQKILELKGLKKADSERLLEAYNLMTGSAAESGKKIKKLFNLGS